MIMSPRMNLPRSLVLFGALALLNVPAGAASTVASVVEVMSENTASSDINYDQQSSSVPGTTVETQVSCAGGCLVLGPSARGTAFADYALNRVYAYASGGLVLSSSASAVSLWTDEWTFSTSPHYAGGPVTLEFHLDGSWEHANLDFDAAVFSADEFPRGGDGRPPFDEYGYPVYLEGVAETGFTSGSVQQLALLPNLFGIRVVEASGTSENGRVDAYFSLSFTPQPGQTYTLASAMKATVDILPSGGAQEGTADFDQSARLSAVYLPQGLTLATQSGAAYNVAVVPEAGTWAMLTAGLALMAWAVRRRGDGAEPNRAQGPGIAN